MKDQANVKMPDKKIAKKAIKNRHIKKIVDSQERIISKDTPVDSLNAFTSFSSFYSWSSSPVPA